MACEENTIQLPINIRPDDAKQYSRNLSKFLYDFKKGKNIDIMDSDKDLKGMFFMTVSDIKNSYLNFTTLGNMTYSGTIGIIKSLNYYKGQKAKMEIVHVFVSKNTSDIVLMFIPFKISSENTGSARFFNSFVPLLKSREDNEFYHERIGIPNIDLNNLIPRSHFMYYNANTPIFGTECNQKFKMILYDTPLNIKRSDYNGLIKVFGSYTDNSLSSSETNPKKNLSNYEKIHNINYKMMYYNKRGTKDGPGKHTGDDIKELTCTPILDEEDKPIDGNRLDWIKQGFEKGISAEFKNLLFILILVVIVVGVIVTVNEFVFKKLGLLVGDKSIVARSKENL